MSMAASLEPWQLKTVSAYMPYVRALVNTKWQQSSKELQADLIQQGYLALCDAVVRFDPERGSTFGAYAKWRVHKYISEYQQMDTTIRKPWSKVKANLPSEIKTVPLMHEGDDGYHGIDYIGREEPGYTRYEDMEYAAWLTKALEPFDQKTQRLYGKWMRGTLDWDKVDSEQQELLFSMDTVISNDR